jgi:four helix bundle protein
MVEHRQGERDLCKRLFTFAIRIVRLCQQLSQNPGVGRTLSYQLLKSGTSVGANYEEGQGAQSRADFTSKNNIALKEARETYYWLRLVQATELVTPELLSDLVDEASQIVKILGAIVNSCRQTSDL